MKSSLLTATCLALIVPALSACSSSSGANESPSPTSTSPSASPTETQKTSTANVLMRFTNKTKCNVLAKPVKPDYADIATWQDGSSAQKIIKPGEVTPDLSGKPVNGGGYALMSQYGANPDKNILAIDILSQPTGIVFDSSPSADPASLKVHQLDRPPGQLMDAIEMPCVDNKGKPTSDGKTVKGSVTIVQPATGEPGSLWHFVGVVLK